MKYFYTLFLISAICFNLQAQRNFKQGYIVTLIGDTTKGFVDHREWGENPREILFKTTEQSAAQPYTPTTIKAFGVNQFDNYQTYSGPITTGAVELNDLRNGIDSSFVTDNIFIRVITGGKNLTLYSYADRIKTRYFIADRNSAPVELKRYVYLDNRRSDRIREFNFYTQQLLAFAIKYAPNNAALTERINKVPYRATDLEEIVLQFNDRTDNYKTTAAKQSGQLFFVSIGANLVQASFFGVDKVGYIQNLFNSNTKTQSVGPTIGAGIDFYFNKNVRRILFRAEVNLAMNKITAHYSGFYTDYILIKHEEDFTINQISASFNPQLVYNIYNKKNFKFFLAGGFQTTFSSFTNNRYLTRNYINDKLEGSTEKTLLYRSITTNLTTKAGVTLKAKVDIYAGYSLPVTISNYPNYGVDLSSYRLGINYLLGEK